MVGGFNWEFVANDGAMGSRVYFNKEFVVGDGVMKLVNHQI